MFIITTEPFLVITYQSMDTPNAPEQQAYLGIGQGVDWINYCRYVDIQNWSSPAYETWMILWERYGAIPILIISHIFLGYSYRRVYDERFSVIHIFLLMCYMGGVVVLQVSINDLYPTTAPYLDPFCNPIPAYSILKIDGNWPSVGVWFTVFLATGWVNYQIGKIYPEHSYVEES